MSTPIIEVKGLVKRFEDVTAVAGIDFSLAKGGCIGLLGPNGAGKTTTLEMLEGIQLPTSGEIRVLGRTWAEDPKGIRERIGITLQETRFYDKLTVEETVRLFRSFYRTGIAVDEAIALVKLDEKRRSYVGKLSGGQRQRLAVAVALVGDPELLFLDEPTTGLDPQSRHSLWDVVLELKRRGRTVLLTTHYMEEAERLCDRIIIVDHGRIIADGTPPELIRKVGGEQMVEVSGRPALPPEALQQIPGLVNVTERGGALVLSVHELHVAVPAVIEAHRARGSELLHLSTRHASLDDVFLAMTGRSLREDNP